MIEHINLFLLLTLPGIIYYIYYKYKIFLHAKTLPTINEEEGNDIRDKRDRLVALVLSGNSKQYFQRKEYTEHQINEMDSNYINKLS